MSIQNKNDLRKAGFIALAGPYQDNEVGMMGRVVEDALASNKEVAYSSSGDWRGTLVWQRRKPRLVA